MQADLSAQFAAFFAEFMKAEKASHLGRRLAISVYGQDLLSLLSELRHRSLKVVTVAIDTLQGLVEVLTEEELLLWVDLAASLTERSGASALKYCRESEPILQFLPPNARRAVLKMALELAEQDGALALEGLRQAGAVCATPGVDALALWSTIGADVARCDYIIGVEYFRRSPDILAVLSLDDLKPWSAVSLKLISTNSLGKPDYIAALTFLRTSAVLLADIPTTAARRRLLALANAMADRDPEKAIELLGEAPGWLRRIPSPEWQEQVLKYGLLVADKDPDVCLAYLRQAPELVQLIGEDNVAFSSSERFEGWFKGGMEVLDYNSEAARAYFATETRTALKAVEQAASGVSLREVSRVLKLFGEGLSGKPLAIRSQGQDIHEAVSSQPVSEEGIIMLPARVRQYPTRGENLLVYKVMTAHEAGHFEYGTYDLDPGRLADLVSQACVRYGRQTPAYLRSLDDLFQCYPEPFLVRDLWQLAEDARIEANLKTEYPGLRRDMEELLSKELSRRSLTHGMSVKEMIVELLLQLSADPVEEVRVPFALEEVVGRAWALLRPTLRPHASAEAVVRAVHRAYVLIEELTAASETWSADPTATESTTPDSPRGGEAQGGVYRALESFTYRGSMDAARVRISTSPPTTAVRMERSEGLEGGAEEENFSNTFQKQKPPSDQSLVESQKNSASSGSQLGDRTDIGDKPSIGAGGALFSEKDPRIFFYDEWDGVIQDYRHQWCRVVELTGAEGPGSFVERTRSVYGGIIGLIRRYFEGIRPTALRRMRRQRDGDEVDIEAVIESLMDRRAQASPKEDVYIRRERHARDVAVAFLVDLSGSTGRLIGSAGARIIDVEKEGLVLLAEALEAIGDQYALYGYSGQSRREVQFLVLKDFAEPYGPAIWRRIDGVQPLLQNRDGAAIRHALHRLSAQSARVKLLVLLSDGRPLDDLYTDEYALEDTKAALCEAKANGLHVFCITVDHEASGYLARMYGDVSYMIIDRIQSLPERLPRIYRMLTT